MDCDKIPAGTFVNQRRKFSLFEHLKKKKLFRSLEEQLRNYFNCFILFTYFGTWFTVVPWWGSVCFYHHTPYSRLSGTICNITLISLLRKNMKKIDEFLTKTLRSFNRSCFECHTLIKWVAFRARILSSLRIGLSLWRLLDVRLRSASDRKLPVNYVNGSVYQEQSLPWFLRSRRFCIFLSILE